MKSVKVKQLDIYGWLEHQKTNNPESKRLVYDKLNSLEHNILNYLKKHHIGLDNAINGKELAERFDISVVKLRGVISKLRKHQEIIIGSCVKNGYYIPLQAEMTQALNYAESKVLSELETRVKQNPNFILKAYKVLNSIKGNLSKAVQDQITMQFNGWEQDVNYFGDKYINNKKEKECDL